MCGKTFERARRPCACKMPVPELHATRKISRFYGKIKCGAHFTTTFPFFSCKITRAAPRKIAFLLPSFGNLIRLYPHTHSFISVTWIARKGMLGLHFSMLSQHLRTQTQRSATKHG